MQHLSPTRQRQLEAQVSIYAIVHEHQSHSIVFKGLYLDHLNGASVFRPIVGGSDGLAFYKKVEDRIRLLEYLVESSRVELKLFNSLN